MNRGIKVPQINADVMIICISEEISDSVDGWTAIPTRIVMRK